MLLPDRAVKADASAQSRKQQELRACLALRLMLLETRQQLNLLCSNFAAARVDAAESISVQQQFPKLLAGFEPTVHVQAGLYAQAVGMYAAASGHFMAVARQAQEQGAPHMAADARHLAVMTYVAENTRESGAQAVRQYKSLVQCCPCMSQEARQAKQQRSPPRPVVVLLQ
jgi:hypothetical protein